MDAKRLEVELHLLIVVAAPGANNQVLLRAADEDERRSWTKEILQAIEACTTANVSDVVDKRQLRSAKTKVKRQQVRWVIKQSIMAARTFRQ